MDVERLINRHKDSVYRQMVRVCGNHADAEDALAEAMLAALQSEGLRDEGAFRSWLATIGVRICGRMRSKERFAKLISMSVLEENGIELGSERDGPAEEAETHEMRTCVASAISSLPDVYRDVYIRREILGQSAAHVASESGLSIAALKSRLHRARALVRSSLDTGLCSGELVA